ncbi:MAG TPA: M28 family peptidase [Thermoanaerobaculia bacterium]
MVDQLEGMTVDEPAPGSGRKPPRWGLITALALSALTLGLTVFRSEPPAPKPKEVSLSEFSAGRAGDILRNLVGDGSPHPVGSPANARVREKIVSHLRWLGYAPEVQEATSCDWGGCARVWNVVARLEGRESGKSVLLMAHYDSVPAGPGVSDDLVGVAAILEIARVLKSGPPPRNPVVFLIDDGEEAGLLGAEAFASRHPAAGKVGAIVNLEGRGTAGPSLMFETAGADAPLLAAFTSQVDRPFTSSLFPTLYERLPNDTDLSVFKRRGYSGLNFAFIENPTRYHTAGDTLEASSPASLQHHGDNALAAVRGLTGMNLSRPLRGKAVYFDLFRFTVVRWPAGWTPALALAALALIAATGFRAIRRGVATGRGALLGLATALAATFFTVMAGFALRALLAGAFPTPWVSRPMPATVAFWLLALAVTLATAGQFVKKLRPSALWIGVWSLWSVLGLVLSFTLPGIGYLFIVPALVAGVCGLLFGHRPPGWAVASLVPSVVAAALWFSVLIFLYWGLGSAGLLASCVLLALVFGTLIPLVPPSGKLGSRWVPLAAAAGVLVATVMAMISPAYSPSSPRALDIQFYQNADNGQANWVVRGLPPLPPPLRKAGGFPPRPQPPFPWSGPNVRAFVAPAPRLDAPPPELTVLADSVVDGKRHLRLRLSSPRGALAGTVLIPTAAKLETIRMDGQTLQTTGRFGGFRGVRWRAVSHANLPPQGSEWEVVLGSTQPAEWIVFDQSYELPPSARPLLEARPDNTVPVQDGDGILVSRKLRI